MAVIFNWTVRIYYEDTDAGGVVFYANYLKYFERARTEWLRACGISQQLLTINHHIGFVVKQVAVDYHAPARLDDELILNLTVKRLGPASISFDQQAWRIVSSEKQLLTTCSVKVGCVDLMLFRSIVLSDAIREKILAFDASLR